MLAKTKILAPEKEPGWKEKSAEDKRAEELKLMLAVLNVNPKQLVRLPQFSEILKHQSLGGLPQVLQAMRLSRDPTIGKFLERYDRLSPGQQQMVPWEAVAMLAEIDGRQLLGAIILALRDQSATEVKVAALTAHPQVTHATVMAAMLPDGFRDRQMIHTALGFLAPPKGQTINVNFPGPADDDDNGEIAAEDIDMNEMFPDLMQTQKKMLPRE